jgi:hypothetical protein
VKFADIGVSLAEIRASNEHHRAFASPAQLAIEAKAPEVWAAIDAERAEWAEAERVRREGRRRVKV